jgi:hypothetical protein
MSPIEQYELRILLTFENFSQCAAQEAEAAAAEDQSSVMKASVEWSITEAVSSRLLVLECDSLAQV